jgi:hypothetical protein
VSFLLAMTMLSANMDAQVNGSMPITVDKHVREVYADQELCLVNQQRHMLTMRPGHIWSGQTPLPDGTYSPCQPTPRGYKAPKLNK